MKPPDRRSWTSLLGEVKPERAVVHRICRVVEEPGLAASERPMTRRLIIAHHKVTLRQPSAMQ